AASAKPAAKAPAAPAKKAAPAPATRAKAPTPPAKPQANKIAEKAKAASKAPSAKVASPVAAPAKAAPKTKDAAPKAAAAPAKTAPAKPAPQPKEAAKAPPAKNVKPAEPAAKKTAAKAAKTASVKTAPESPPIRKPLVGQKPRSERPASAEMPPLSFLTKAPDPVDSPTAKTAASPQETKLDFKVDDHVVYPAHGVGRIVGIERQVIAGIVNDLYVIGFEQEKMILRVPTAKARAVGMRPLSDAALVKKSIELLKGRARIKRTMWSRRAQEYEAKINSGDILSVAEVVRDLFRASDQPEQSYSERQLFEQALDRLAREVAAVHKSDLAAAIAELEAALQQKKAA
ncbi:MAG: hypothetical protein K2Q06_00590, partial [Parvularculaceae bacterium]|nr:hypothetical protein [Parvularculaceae bacterium]